MSVESNQNMTGHSNNTCKHLPKSPSVTLLGRSRAVFQFAYVPGFLPFDQSHSASLATYDKNVIKGLRSHHFVKYGKPTYRRLHNGPPTRRPASVGKTLVMTRSVQQTPCHVRTLISYAPWHFQQVLGFQESLASESRHMSCLVPLHL
jgi:hypothetical protein